MAMRNAAAAAREEFGEEYRCTEFTTDDVDTTGESDVFGAFVCSGCGKHNPLTGDPIAFRDVVVRCMGCTHVQVLDSAALAAFITERAIDAA